MFFVFNIFPHELLALDIYYKKYLPMMFRICTIILANPFERKKVCRHVKYVEVILIIISVATDSQYVKYVIEKINSPKIILA